MKFTKKNEKPQVEIHDALEHGPAHCHVGQSGKKVFIYTNGIYAEDISKKDLYYVFQYKDSMLAHLADMNWTVTAYDGSTDSAYFHSW